MKIFFHRKDLTELIPRTYLAEWVKPLFPKLRHSLYGLNPQDLATCREQSDADAFVLPLTWEYYFERKKVQDALALIDEYEKWNKPIYTWVGGEHTYKIPKGNFILFCHSGYQSIRRQNEYTYPVIIQDPLKYLNLSKIKVLQKETKPKIGFCGLADRNWIDGSLRKIKASMFKMVNTIRKPYLDLTQPILGTALRRRVLRILSGSDAVETDFVIRSTSGGQKINSNTFKLEFWQNVMMSPYVLCVRGAGNYSARFYEAMAMGRIPVLINTDCILPMDNEIDWKQHCIWVEAYELDNICDRINTFHRWLSNDDYEKLQILNRELWADKLTYGGFYKSFNSNYET